MNRNWVFAILLAWFAKGFYVTTAGIHVLGLAALVVVAMGMYQLRMLGKGPQWGLWAALGSMVILVASSALNVSQASATGLRTAMYWMDTLAGIVQFGGLSMGLWQAPRLPARNARWLLGSTAALAAMSLLGAAHASWVRGPS